MKKIGILNLGINNIKSINNACKIIGSAYVINKRSDFINNTDVIVLPGNGNFHAGIKMIKDLKFDEIILNFFNKRKKIITICLGLQLLMEKSEESKNIRGLSIIKGNTVKIDSNKFRIPLLGWYDVEFDSKDEDKKSFFFNNNYMVKPDNDKIIKAKVNSLIPAYIEFENIYGFQFHPEKSSIQGLNLLKKTINC